MINAARRTIVLADLSKFGHGSFAHIAPLERVQILIPDQAPPKDLAEAFREMRTEVIIADQLMS